MDLHQHGPLQAHNHLNQPHHQPHQPHQPHQSHQHLGQQQQAHLSRPHLSQQEAGQGQLDEERGEELEEVAKDNCDDDEDAFVASCADASFVLNPHNNNPSRRLYINKLYQPMNGANQMLDEDEEQDDELMLYQELESLESTVLKSAKGRRRRLTKILEDDEDEFCFDADDDDDDDEQISGDGDDGDDEVDNKRSGDTNDDDLSANDKECAQRASDRLRAEQVSDFVRQTEIFDEHELSSDNRLRLATIIDSFESDTFPPSPLSEPSANQAADDLLLSQSAITTTTTPTLAEMADEISIDHHHHHQQQQQQHHHHRHNHQHDQHHPEQRQPHLLVSEQHKSLMSYETPPISTYSESFASANELMMSQLQSPLGSQASCSGAELTCEPVEGAGGAGADVSKYRRRTANARERIRMREINQAFEKLKRVVPIELIQQHQLQQAAVAAANNGQSAPDDEWAESTDGGASRKSSSAGQQQQQQQQQPFKLTKITTLRLAKSYITILTDLLKEPADGSHSAPITGAGDNETTDSSANCNSPLADSSTPSAGQLTGAVKVPPSNLFNNNNKRKAASQPHQRQTDSRRRAYKRRQPSAGASSTCQVQQQQQQQQASKRRPSAASLSFSAASSSPATDENCLSQHKVKADNEARCKQQQIVSSTTATCNAIAISHNQSQPHPQHPQQQQQQPYASCPDQSSMSTIQLPFQPAARHHPIILAATNNMIGRCLLSTNNGYIQLAPPSQAASQPLRTFVTPVAVAFFGLSAANSAATPAAAPTNCGWISQAAPAPVLAQHPQPVAALQPQPQPQTQAQLQLHLQAQPPSQCQPQPQCQAQSQQQQPLTTMSPIKNQSPMSPAKQVPPAKQQPTMRTYRFHNYDGKSLYANNQDNKHNQQQQQQQQTRKSTTTSS